MGKVSSLVRTHVNNGDKIFANTTCDYLLVCDTSNYGAYSLIGAIEMELI